MAFSSLSTRRSFALAATLVLVVALPYLGSLRGDFLWDDDLHISANPTIVGPLGLEEIWTSARANYFPLVLTNLWAQHALWGLEPLGYRLVTLGCHVLAALLLWRVLHALRIPGAWIGAALWALHPVQVESVAWICELKNTQSAIFFLAAAACWIRWLHAGESSPPAPRGRFYAAALACAALAILSKPSTVMLPVALALAAWWLRRRVAWRDLWPLAPFFALSALAAGWTIWEQKFHSGAVGEAWAQTFPERIAIAGRVVWFYLGKIVWPEPLIFIYPRWQIDGRNASAYLGAVAALAAFAFLLWRARRGRAHGVLFAAGYFAALLFPILGFFSVYFFRYSFVGDHFQYLASMGPLALAGAGLAALGPRRGAVAAGALLLALAALSARHSRAFLSSEALWRHTLARNPGAVMAWLNLGDTLAQAKRHEESIATYRHALTLKPADAPGWNDLGCELVIVGRPAEALPCFERSLALRPDYPEALNNLGNALRDLGRVDESIARHRRATELDPAYAEAHNNLGAALAHAGHYEAAAASFQAALRLRPRDAATHDNLGSAWRNLGRFDAAVAAHTEALRLDPRFAEAHANLGRTLADAGRTAESLPPLERALELKPALPFARGRYAAALESLGRREEALAQFRRAVELAPESPEVHANLGTALAGAQRWPEAAASFARDVALRPDSAAARQQLAVALVNDERLVDAVPHFEAALRLEPSAQLHDQFGQVLRALGRNREAFEQFERAADLRRRK